MVDFPSKEFYDLADFIKIVDVLRGEGGCPWDREQTHESLRRGTLEEAYELCGAIDSRDAENLREVTEHFRFDMEGLTITNSGTGMGIGVSEQRVIFTGGESPTTVIYPNSMETAAMTVHSTLTLGDYSLIPRTNGNLSLRCTGAN